MPIDAYQLCPCGSGKKIKFCGCKDLLKDLENITRMLEGDQVHAALAELNRLLEKQPDRSALLALKVTVLLRMGESEELKDTVKHFLNVDPKNPIGLAQSAMVEASERNSDEAVKLLQLAIEECDDSIPYQVYEAAGLVGQVLLMNGRYLPARGHLLQRAAWSGGEDEEAIQIVLRLDDDRDVPYLLKLHARYVPCPEGVPWNGEFNAALKSARRGTWQLAAEQFETLAEKAGEHESILRNLALVRGWLGDSGKTIAAWRRLAALEGLPYDDAVEAEAIAQLLDPKTHASRIDDMRVVFPVTDANLVSELLLADRHTDRANVDPNEFRSEDQPPPKGVFWLLDKEQPETGVDIERDAIPSIRGSLVLFGKETDREARVELNCLKNDEYEAVKDQAKGLLAEFGGDIEKEEKVDDVSAVSAALNWKWALPDDTPPETAQELTSAYRQEIVTQVWPSTQMSVLDNKTPLEAAGDSSYAIRLGAAAKLFEINATDASWGTEFSDLREKLKLPAPQKVDVKGRDIDALSSMQLERLDMAELDDVQLVRVLQQAVSVRANVPTKLAAEEILRRDNYEGGMSKPDVYLSLARAANGNDERLKWIELGREASVAVNESAARWLIMELPLRLERGEPDKFEAAMNTLQQNHFEEPGVREQVYRLLVQMGVLSPDGQPMPAVGGQGDPSGMSSAPATASEPEGLWTPDSPAPSASEGGKESKLWVPGMD